MKRTITLFYLFFTLISSFAQKIIKTGEFSLFSPHSNNSYINNEIVGLGIDDKMGLQIYSWQPIFGKVLEKPTMKPNSSVGSPFFNEKTFSDDLKLVKDIGEFVSVKQLDKSKEYVFQNGNGQSFPIKSFLTDIFEKYQNFELIKLVDNEVKWGDYNNALSWNDMAGFPDINTVSLFPNNSDGTYEKVKIKQDKFSKENSTKFLRYVRGNGDTDDKKPYTTQISKNMYQALIKFNDKEQSFSDTYKNFKIISFYGNGKVSKVEDVPLKYAGAPESYLSLYNINGEIDGSLTIFEPFSAGSKKIKNPQPNNYYLVVSNAEGKITSKLEFNYGEKGKALNTQRAYKMGENLYIENYNTENNNAFEIIEINKEGKVNTLKKIEKKYQTLLSESDKVTFNDNNYYDEFRTLINTNNSFYLILQKKVKRTLQDEWQYGNIFIQEFKKDFTKIRQIMVGQERKNAPSNFEMVNTSDTETKILINNDKNYIVTINELTAKIEDITPTGFTIPNPTILTKNYIKIPNSKEYYFIFKNSDIKLNTGKIILFEF